MFNLYKNSINPDGFIALVGKNLNTTTDAHAIDSRKIVSGFAVASLLIMSVMANGSQSQKISEFQKLATISSYTVSV
ncbi:MAG: hypothetical protein P8H03_04520 [Emcibacteraceae bacterium]|nr:hypothetical protein [Emcibacteraceae bacterium]MDG1858455.1 hypothetical protein [Emcibacteraceae bacterium]